MKIILEVGELPNLRVATARNAEGLWVLMSKLGPGSHDVKIEIAEIYGEGNNELQQSQG